MFKHYFRLGAYMLSQSTINTIKSTVPVLSEHGGAITQLFYKKLFEQYPELKNIFNQTNQIKGEQPRALADSVFMYAKYIDQLDQLTPMVTRIAHKHASLGVKPEHYPIVGKLLLESIQEHLDLKTDHEVLAAWGEAYQALANIFIEAEKAIYSDNAQKPGGWEGYRNFEIKKITPESQGVKSFELEPQQGKELCHFLPGQYIGVRVKPEPEGYYAIRQYSLSNAPGEGFFQITVKAEENKTGTPGQVSHYLHQAQIGDYLELRAPTGDFTLTQATPKVVLIAGGVGITPLISMLKHHIKQGTDVSDWIFIQCCQNSAHQIMAKELNKLSQETGFKYIVSYDNENGANHKGYLNKEVLSQWLEHHTESPVYFCGPLPFMKSLNTYLTALGFNEDQLFYETFGPSTRL